MEKFTEKPAVGTRVTLRKVAGDAWYSYYSGKSGAVVGSYGITGECVLVRFDDGGKDYGQWTSLEPEATPAVAAAPEPAPEVTLNGHRYVLAPEQAEAKEEKREPDCGEIWRMSDGRLVAIGQDHDRDTELRAVVLNPRNRGVIISQSGAAADRQLKDGKLTFA
ncbi:hypothetical protein, partial [Deinococcus wulumuqiensis]